MRLQEQVFDDFKAGHIQSFYDQVYPSLLRYAERVVGDDHAYLAEDCVQEAIFKVYLRRQQFTDAEAMESYLFVCLRNEITTLFRKRDRHNRYIEHREAPDEATFFDHLVMQETLDRLYAAIDGLPDRLRQLFEMSFEQGLKNIEIAQLLNVSAETIKKRKAKLISTLRTRFHDDERMQLIITLLLTV